MIYSLSGKLLLKEPNAIVVECGGVGFRCAASVYTVQQMPQQGEQVSVYTHLSVREDAMELFAFCDREEMACFKKLISVSGVGPKVALAILSDITPSKFNLYVVTGDVKAITKAQGVGPKLAQRIVLELKDKVDLEGSASADVPTGSTFAAGGAQNEAISALVALGYTQTEAAGAVAHLDPALSVEDMIRNALRQMM